jgi:hypothetical protein
MSELDYLMTILNNKIVHHQIIINGNCFFHALEYALGKCKIDDIDDKHNNLYNKTRQEVSDLLLEQYNKELDPETLFQKYLDDIDDIDDIESIEQKMFKDIEEINKKIRFIRRFRTSLVFSTDEVVFFSALLKKKVLFVVREQKELENFQTTLIIPQGVEIKKENILVMIHSDGLHYNTLTYPLNLSDKFVEMLIKYNKSNDGILDRFPSTGVKEIVLKFGSLKDVLKHYQTTIPQGVEKKKEKKKEKKIKKREENDNMNKEKQIKKNYDFALKLAMNDNMNKENQIKKNYDFALKLAMNDNMNSSHLGNKSKFKENNINHSRKTKNSTSNSQTNTTRNTPRVKRSHTRRR